MLPTIKKSASRLVAARNAMRHTLAREQKTCPHKSVVHSPWRSSDYGSAFKARRLCLDCGLEEEAKHSGWGDNDSDFKHLKTKGFHKVESDSWKFYALRFPEGEVDGPVLAQTSHARAEPPEILSETISECREVKP